MAKSQSLISLLVTSASRHHGNLDGSDAMNRDPDYSAAYVTLHTDGSAADVGHGLTFTTGRGNDLCVAAINALADARGPETLESITADMAGFSGAYITGDPQFLLAGAGQGNHPSGNRGDCERRMGSLQRCCEKSRCGNYSRI